MKDIRAPADLGGLWSAIPMPWTPAGDLNVEMLERNIARLAAVPCDGIYSTDSDGEFYALELAEFRQFVATFSRLLRPTGCGVQVGVTWTNTQGIIERMKVCLDHGISCVHICYPYWMPLNRDDVRRFWEDLANAVPQARWIHYSTLRGHVRMSGRDYETLAQQYPEQLVGTKLATQNFLELSEIMGTTPDLAHFVTDFVVVPGIMLGARGVYSFWVNTLPNWQRRLVNLCLAGSWDEATELQRKFNCWESHCVEPWVAQGYLHAIVAKARGAASGFLEDEGVTRAPYQRMPAQQADKLAAAFRRWWSSELAQEPFMAQRHATQ